MDGFLILIAVAWFILSAVSKKKKREAAQAAKRAEEQGAQQPSTQQDKPAPVVTASAPKKAQQSSPFDPFFGGLLGELSAEPEPTRPAKPAQAMSAPTPVRKVGDPAMQPTRKAALEATLAPTYRHALEASPVTGHAHMESSLTGFEPVCPPETRNTRASAPIAPAVSVAQPATAFCWSVEDARRGLVLAEILGRPKALR